MDVEQDLFFISMAARMLGSSANAANTALG